MKIILMATAAIVAGSAAAAPALAQEAYEDRTARRCCEVDRGRWVNDPWSNWTPRDCRALGEEGEFAPQGTSEAGACAADEWPPTGEPDPIPPTPDPEGGDGDGDRDDDGDDHDEDGREGDDPVITYGGERGPGNQRDDTGGGSAGGAVGGSMAGAEVPATASEAATAAAVASDEAASESDDGDRDE